MVIAQEIIGRPYLMIYGIKLTTVVWIFIAIFLGLIFSMTMWPSLWRRIYQKSDKEAKKTKFLHKFKAIPWQLAVILIIIAVFAFIAGTFLGFNTAVDNVEAQIEGCSAVSCESIYVDCPECKCASCDNAIKITIPKVT